MDTEVYRFKVGDFECMAVSDGNFAYPDQSFFVNAPRKRLEQMLREHKVQPGAIMTPWTCLFIDTGHQRVLVDTGGGPAGASMVPSIGKLLPNLETEGIAFGGIDKVILTHGHPDHIGGCVGSEGKPTFPQARYVMWKDEWEFWMSEPNLAQLEVDEDFKQIMLMVARHNLPPIRGQLDLVDHETEIVPGVRAVPAPGHTPGHMAVIISSGGEQLFCISDVALHPIHLEQPDWYPAFDLLHEQAMATRRKLMNRAATEKALILAFHFPFPGLGHIVQKEAGWRWQPLRTK